MSKTTKHCIFALFFNCNSDKERNWAEKKREDSLMCLKGLFENKAKFSCIAKDQTSSCLLLRGCCNLNSPCKRECAKRLFGKCSSLKPSYFGDMVNLCRFVHIDRNLTVTGRLPRIGNGNDSKAKLKPFATDPKFVVRVLLDAIDKDEQPKSVKGGAEKGD